jgi:short-subunit dehydrogenase
MIARGSGVILLTGALASVKGYPDSSSFAMGKFALRGLASSMARELSPKGVHVAHFVIDGGIRSTIRSDPNESPDSTLDPDAIAETWTWEVELPPWVEKLLRSHQHQRFCRCLSPCGLRCCRFFALHR